MKVLFKNPRPRRKSDFYPTPPEAVIALERSGALLGFPFGIWEPACGDGAISRALESLGYRVESSDIGDYGYGMADLDFLEFKKPIAPAIITNPPFSLAAEFIAQARKLGVEYLALLLKADFWCAAGRADLFEAWPPARILPLTWRLDFTGNGSGPMNCAWYVWRPGDTSARVSLLRKPE